ncbi:hypothetical protein ACFRJ1_36210 [Streptomyces sp. NPDC056773]|uniref:hypothetical protein n=1 Tax=unclassified Streptomyces TaxID=2593676 RepID=UPI0036871317
MRSPRRPKSPWGSTEFDPGEVVRQSEAMYVAADLLNEYLTAKRAEHAAEQDGPGPV